jgi:hypothetical protein
MYEIITVGSLFVGVVSFQCLREEKRISLKPDEINSNSRGFYDRASYDFNNDGWLDEREVSILEDFARGKFEDLGYRISQIKEER